jgi:hypothetical protein
LRSLGTSFFEDDASGVTIDLKGLDEAYEIAIRYRNDVAEMQDKIQTLQHDIRVQTENLKELSKNLNRDRARSIQAFESEQLGPFVEKKANIDQRISILRQMVDRGVDPYEQNLLEVEISKLEEEKAKVEISRLKKELEVNRKIISDYANFADPKLQEEYTEADKKVRELENLLVDYKMQLHELEGKSQDIMHDMYQARVGRLEYVDFLYFSLGVSTTTTIGDIVPNSRGIRLMVVVQLIAGAIVFGILISFLAEAFARRGSETDR